MFVQEPGKAEERLVVEGVGANCPVGRSILEDFRIVREVLIHLSPDSELGKAHPPLIVNCSQDTWELTGQVKGRHFARLWLRQTLGISRGGRHLYLPGTIPTVPAPAAGCIRGLDSSFSTFHEVVRV